MFLLKNAAIHLQFFSLTKVKTLIDQRESVNITIIESVLYKEALDGFRTCGVNEVAPKLYKMKKQTCYFNLLPSCIDVLAPMITYIIDASITQSHVPL